MRVTDINIAPHAGSKASRNIGRACFTGKKNIYQLENWQGQTQNLNVVRSESIVQTLWGLN